MPWEIVAEDEACPISEPFGVHKIGTGELVGCHVSRTDALEQLAALNIAEPQDDALPLTDMMPEPAAEVEDVTIQLNDRQSAQYEATELIAETFGKWDQSSDPDGAHYAEVSPFDGLVCASCVFYEGGRGCEVVTGDIDPAGVCKLWIIPGDLITEEPAATEPMAEPMADPAVDPMVGELSGEYVRSGSAWTTPEVERREIKDAELRMENGRPVLEGYATVYNYSYPIGGGPESGGFSEIIARGAATKSVSEAGNRDDVRLLIDHAGTPLARTKSGTLQLSSDDVGLKVRAELDPANPRVIELNSAMERGDVDSMSFAFRAVRQSWNDDYSVRTISEVKLYDVSVVTFPANPATVVKMRSRDVVSAQDPQTVGRSVRMARLQADQMNRHK